MPQTVAHVVGARPNFVKAAPVIRALASRGIAQRLIHTGQHYDAAMSDVFFRELGLPEPDLNLGVGSGTQAGQTAALLVALAGAFADLQPSLVLVYGDVNSTLAAALVAAKLRLPCWHVEAGLRSFDDSMPEEINRRVTDLLAEQLFVTCPEGLDNLAAVGTPKDRIHVVGNPMIDSLVANEARIAAAAAGSALRPDGPYAVVTLHRPGNVDDPERARAMVGMLHGLVEVLPVVLPLHPRG
ncbi:MAG TPA: UDP-N-acetylglucosamine 2-epimerase, partial [Candidatus Limnocylindrales bacterium]